MEFEITREDGSVFTISKSDAAAVAEALKQYEAEEEIMLVMDDVLKYRGEVLTKPLSEFIEEIAKEANWIIHYNDMMADVYCSCIERAVNSYLDENDVSAVKKGA